MPAVMRDFLVYHEAVKGKSARSISEYQRDLRTFFRYLKYVRGLVPSDTEFSEIPVQDVSLELLATVTTNDIYAFLVFCKNERGNNATTRARKCSTLRIFFKYLCAQTKQLPNNPAELLETPKTAKTLPKFLTLEESGELLAAVDGPNRTRDYCILTLFLNCGMRLSELCGLNVTDVRGDTLRVVGKGNKERLLYLNDACRAALAAYLPNRPVDGLPATEKDALFISRNHRRISNQMVQHIVYQALEKAGLGGQGLSVHKLRHTAATLMYQYGHTDVRVLQEVLGHENLNTTRIYTHVSDDQLKAAFASNPLSGETQKPPKKAKSPADDPADDK